MTDYCAHCGEDASDFHPEASVVVALRFRKPDGRGVPVSDPRAGLPMVICAICSFKLVEFLEPLRVHETSWGLAKGIAEAEYDNHRKGKQS